MVYVGKGVLASGVDMLLEKDLESTIPLNEIISQIPPSIAITPVLPTLEPEDSLIMGNEELSTIPEKESDEVIKSSVENLVPIPSESEDTSGNDSERRFNIIYDYDDDDDGYEASTIPLNEINSQIPPSIAITPILPTLEPEDSLIMGNEELSTIPEKESDEFIKSNVEDLVPIPSESEDTSESDSDCDLPSCDDFSPINVYEEKSVTFSNPLFDANDDFTSSDDELLSDEDVPEDNVKIYSNPLFKFDDEYISSAVNPLFDEVLEDIESKDSYVSNLYEPALLVTPLFDVNKDECFDPGGDIDEIDVFLDIDISTDIKDGYHDSEGDIIYLESLLFYSLEPMAYESPMMIFPFFYFCPKDKGIRGDLDPFVEIPSGESKVHIEVLSLLWGNRLPILDGSLPLSRLIKVYCLWSVRSRCGSLQKKAYSKNNKSETDKSLLDHGRLAYRCDSFQKGRGSPGRNKTPGPLSARIPMWQFFKGPGGLIMLQ
ncbi:hypothetical protein Tco_1515854 [Tanacetum coccineum]